jgi:cyclic pyranopterin phosphate synthase
MIDVSEKETTPRRAVATGRIRMAPETLRAIVEGRGPKGDVLQVARLAGIMGGKRTGDLIPLCHLLPDASVDVDVRTDEDLPGVVVRAQAKVKGRTGVEMEALTAVSVALLTVYDMVKGLDRGMVVEEVRLVRKDGGRSGTWEASEP